MTRVVIGPTTPLPTWKDAYNALDSDVGVRTNLTTANRTSVVAAIRELDSDLFGAGGGSARTSLTTTSKTILGAINEHDAELGTISSAAMGTTASTVSGAIKEHDSDIGNRASLTTTNKANLVVAINEVDSDVGNRASLTTINRSTLVAAVNELDGEHGVLSSLTTTNKATFVAAINEIDSDLYGAGGGSARTSLTTTSKTILAAINEHDAELGTISSAAMGTTASTVSGAIKEHDSDMGNRASLTTVNKSSLVAAINEVDSDVGNRASLTTISKASLVAAINELDGEHGVLSSLTTTNKATFVAAINEVDSDVGNRSLLTTANKNSLVAALNEVDSDVGNRASLTTANKNSLVAAINEHDAELGTISSAAMGTTASTVSGAIKEHDSDIGNRASLTTANRTSLVAAINEVDSDVGNRASLTTANKATLVLAVNELKTRLDSIDAGLDQAVLVTSNVRFDGGVNVDNINIDGTTIALSAGSLTVDVAARIVLDADSATWTFADGGVTRAQLSGTSNVTLGGLAANFTVDAAGDIILDADGANVTLQDNGVTVLDFVLNSPTLVTLDAPGRIVLDADSGSVALHNGGVQYGAFVDSSSNLVVRSGSTPALKFNGADAQFQGIVRSTAALTTVQQDFAAAINELKARVDAVDSSAGLILDSAFNAIGSFATLLTPVKTNVVAAINSMYESAGVANTIRSVARLALSNGTGLAYSNGQFSVANNGISAAQLNTDAVTTVKILDDNVTYTKIQNVATANRVLGSKTANGVITELLVDSDILGDNSVLTAKIRDRAVTNIKVAVGAIDSASLASNAISTTKIQNNAVTLAKLANSGTAKRVIASTTAGTFYSEQQVDSDMLGSLSIANRHIQNNAVTLGTQTTGNYVASVSSANGIKIVGTAGEGWTPTVSLDSAATGTITNLNVIGNLDVAGLTTLDSATIDGNLIVTGNLTISGTTTTVNTETITVNDNIIVLNNNAPNTPTENAGVEVERGLSTNVQLIWNETTDRWTFTNNGTTYHNIPTTDEYIDSATSKFPTTYAWTGGTTSGPTGSLTGNNLTAISFPAIPSAGAAASGIVTTDAQTFAGVKTFSSTISGSITGNAGTVTNGVYTTGDQTIGGNKTFSSTITGSITGNAGTATTLATGRNFSLTGPITAPAISFNGSGVVALATSITAGAVDSAALGALSVSSAKLQANIPDSKLATISTAGKVANTATTATSLNTANAIVARDASGNFVAGTITGSITGNAGTATTLATSRDFSITGAVTAPAVSFNGSGVVALNTSITAGAVDSAALGSNSVTAAKIAANAVGFSQMADSAVGSNELRQAVQLIIYNSAGTELKSMYGAGE
jgi:hypothetical protein